MCYEPNEDYFPDNDEFLIDEISENGNYYDNDEDFLLGGPEFDEGSDRDNWEAEQVFMDREHEGDF